MPRLAFGCIEEISFGRWYCLRDITIQGPLCPIDIKAGQIFYPRSVFGGYSDFTAYLTSVSIESAPILPRKE